MSPRAIFVLCLAGCLNLSAALAQVAPKPPRPPVHAPGGVWISIENDYEAELNFGPLGNGRRKGVDTAEGLLTRQGNSYSGTVTARVKSTQQLSGMLGVGSCPQPGKSGDYDDTQELMVIGHAVSGFNDDVQTVSWTASSAQSSLEFLMLEFAPKTMTSQQPGPRLPPSGPQDPFLEDLVIACHTLIDTTSGIAFLPLNDSRWTMDGGGYIIALPLVGVLTYTDDTLAPRQGAPALPAMPFKAKKSLWTIDVERL
jgi:hypothetical protein